MKTLIKNISSLVTVNNNGKLYKTGKEMADVGEIKDGAILFDEKILWIGTTEECDKLLAAGELKTDTVISAAGKTVLPGFVDSHTHVVFGGNRSNEFARRLRGATYKEIAEEGGGILATMKATRAASVEDLCAVGRKLSLNALRYGTTSIEIKSGYGLTVESELKQLEAANKLKSELPMHVSITFMGAHDFPPEYANDREGYVNLLINEMLPAVAKQGYAEYCDAFVDQGYYTSEQSTRIFNAAKALGLKIRSHADEMADVAAAENAANAGAISADHLLFVSDSSIEAMKKSGTVATMMPGTAYFIRMPYAPARKIIDSGAITALATDCNPGSCFTENMQMVLSLAVINMKMTAEEALNAATINGAYALRISDKRGSLEVGKCADILMADASSYTDLFYHFGVNHIESVWTNGEKVV